MFFSGIRFWVTAEQWEVPSHRQLLWEPAWILPPVSADCPIAVYSSGGSTPHWSFQIVCPLSTGWFIYISSRNQIAFAHCWYRTRFCWQWGVSIVGANKVPLRKKLPFCYLVPLVWGNRICPSPVTSAQSKTTHVTSLSLLGHWNTTWLGILLVDGGSLFWSNLLFRHSSWCAEYQDGTEGGFDCRLIWSFIHRSRLLPTDGGLNKSRRMNEAS